MKYNIERPIGLRIACEAVDEICIHPEKYALFGLRPSHFIIKNPDTPDSKREAFIKYMAYRYKEKGILKFNSGKDLYFFHDFDGTLYDLKKCFRLIDSAAVYTNHYEHVVGLDVSRIAEHHGETLEAEFLNRIVELCRYAVCVFFVREHLSSNEEKLLDIIFENIDDVKILTVEPYTKEDFCELITKRITGFGIEIRDREIFRDVAMDLVTGLNISTEKEATAAADSLVDYVIFSGRKPYIDENCMKSLLANWRKNMKGVK